jgi:TonB family protein
MPVRTFLILLLLATSSVSIAQSTYTFFLNKKMTVCEEPEAMYTRQFLGQQDTLYLFEDYTYPEKALYQKGTVHVKAKSRTFYTNADQTFDEERFLRENRHVPVGLVARYFPNGQMRNEGEFVDGRLQGRYKSWYESGQPKEVYVYLDSAELDQTFLIIDFYDSLGNQLVTGGMGNYPHEDDQQKSRGQVIDGYKHGEWVGTFDDGLSKFREQYNMGKMLEGVSLDSAGNEYPYDEIIKQPTYGTDMREFYIYLSSKLVYPRDAVRMGIEGRVYVEFVVDKEGNTTDVKAVRGIWPSCDEQAVRVVESADQFTPGRFRGQLAKIRLVLPVTFRLN